MQARSIRAVQFRRKDARDTAGLNESATHTDFMVGSPEVEIDGVEPGGAEVPLLREGVWQLA